MWFEILFGIAIFKLFKRFIYDANSDAISDLDSKYYDISLAVADRLEKNYEGTSYVGLRIPDSNTSSKQHIDIVLVTKSQVIVVAVRNYSGFVDVGNDGSWICVKDGKRSETHPNPFEEVTNQAIILESYLEQRGVAMPKGHLTRKIVLPNPNCRTCYLIASQPEVISFEKWSALKPDPKGSFSKWIKDALPRINKDNQDALHQRLHSILSTAPMWDRIEYKGGRHVLGEFIDFNGNREDMQALSQLKRSKVAQIIIQKPIFFGKSRVRVLYKHRDYRNEGSSSLVSEWGVISVKQGTQVIFQPTNSKRSLKFMLSNIVSLTLTA